MQIAQPRQSLRVATTRWPAVATVLALTLAAVITAEAHNFMYDDAYITLRYAAILAETGELAWNPGERIEGFTNFLYTLWLGGLLKLGADPETAARASGLAGVALTVAGAALAAARLCPDRAAHAVGAALVVSAGTAGLIVWGLSGMEAPLVAACVTWTLWALLPLDEQPLPVSRSLLVGAICAVGYLVRMDAVVPLATLVGAALLFGSGPFGDRVRAGLVILGVVAATIALHLAWRQVYFGEWMPNTYWAKVGVDRGHRFEFGQMYLIGSLLQAPLLLLACLLGVTALGRRATRRWAAVLLLTAAAQFAYVVWSGGDHLPVGRFLVAVVGPLAVLMALSVSQMTSAGRWVALFLMAATGLWAGRAAPIPMHGGAEAGLIVGRHIAETVPEDRLIALNVAGATPFVASRHRFVDMLGLNDAHIARVTDLPLATARQKRPGHAKGDGAYVLSREPDIIIPGPAEGVEITDSKYLGGRQLAASAEFARCYVLRRETISAPGNHWLRYTGRGDRLVFTYYARTCD